MTAKGEGARTGAGRNPDVAAWRKINEARFWSKIERTDSCWVWTGARNPDGYAYYWENNRRSRAHRLAWQLACGPIPKGLLVLHRCDNPSCVRPTHLFAGTQSDNIRDMYRKGREGDCSGRRHGSKTRQRAIRIKRAIVAGYPVPVIAARYGVSLATVRKIKRGLHWKEV